MASYFIPDNEVKRQNLLLPDKFVPLGTFNEHLNGYIEVDNIDDIDCLVSDIQKKLELSTFVQFTNL